VGNRPASPGATTPHGAFRVVGSGTSLRIECRIPGADLQSYLAFARRWRRDSTESETDRAAGMLTATCTPRASAARASGTAGGTERFAMSEFAARALAAGRRALRAFLQDRTGRVRAGGDRLGRRRGYSNRYEVGMRLEGESGAHHRSGERDRQGAALVRRRGRGERGGDIEDKVGARPSPPSSRAAGAPFTSMRCGERRPTLRG